MKLKYIRIVLFILLISNCTYSQKYILVDSIVDTYPKDLINQDKLVELINKDFSKEDEKARAVFRWITTNIAYDINLGKVMDSKAVYAFSYKTEKEKEIKEKKFKSDLVIKTMVSRIAVCHGYAALVEYVYLKLGLETKIVIGTLKSDPSQIGVSPHIINHAWNVIRIDNTWRFIDTTLGAGFISTKTNSFKFYFNDSYFFTDPERFFLNHYPLDEKWLLAKKNKNNFAALPLFFGSYFENNYQMIKPESGLYSSGKNENFTFAIKGLNPYDEVGYYFDTESKLKSLSQEDNSKDFNISLSAKKEGYLSLFVNRKIIAIYKIIPK